MNLTLNINGFDIPAHYDDADVRDHFLPFLRTLTERRRHMSRRLVVFLAAPPAAGKSTLAAFLERLSLQDGTLEPVQALGLDGFHHRQQYLRTHTIRRGPEEFPLAQIKGAPETFDVEKLRRTLAGSLCGSPLWPVYDRRLHDVVEDALPTSAGILLLEGNWLLLRDPAWSSLPRDLSLFISAGEADLRDRLIHRKMRGGLSRPEAEAFYLRSDLPNIRRCLADSLPGDHRWRLTGSGRYLPL